jgi:hypothetical protein
VYHWQSWEEFVALHRMWNNLVFAGQNIRWCDLHRGADLGDNADSVVCIPDTSSIHQASERFSTKTSGNILNVSCEDGTFNLLGRVIINAEGAPFADHAVRLQMKDGSQCTEAGQAKMFQKSTLTDSLLKTERKKGADDSDYFVALCTGLSEITSVPPKTAIVHKGNRDAYFGPFLGRSILFTTPINGNTAPRALLESVHGISADTADTIITERNIRSFGDAADCVQRVNACFPKKRPMLSHIVSGWYW